jgi:hypothetical protein
MPSLTINLTSFAVIIWSGMLIIAGSVWVLTSQVRKLVDVIEERGRLEDARARLHAGETHGPASLPMTPRLRLVERPISRVN